MCTNRIGWHHRSSAIPVRWCGIIYYKKHKKEGRPQFVQFFFQSSAKNEVLVLVCFFGSVFPDLYLLNQFDTGEQVHAEIDEGPLDTFPGVLFLFQDEHVVVKELLQLFVGKVNAKLLETVVLEKSRVTRF